MKNATAIILLALIFSSALVGQVPNAPNLNKNDARPQAATKQQAVGGHELTAEDVEAFLDGLVPQQLKPNDIAGATLVIVKDGKVLAARGYGYADVEKKKPVSPQETLFRPGSVSKLFTWTSVMQLFERGKLDLDRDLNDYLDFKIPEAFGKPITLKNVMTHTTGFEEQIKDLFTSSVANINLGDYVRTHVPKRIFPPGTVPAYSNYATALAGYIVERVSGKPFAQYVDENIFKPLRMTHSTFTQPLPENLAPLMSNGYQVASEPPKPFELVNAFPAGSLSTTAIGMAQFMLAHLQDGQLGGERILNPDTARLMHGRLFALDESANAMCYGFYEESRNGHRIIGHAGDTFYFHSDLHLILDAGVGFFVSYNSAGRGETSPRTMLWEAFLDRYFPYAVSASSVLPTAKDDINKVSGAYIFSRRSDSSFLKTASLIGELMVSATENGMLEVNQLTGPNGKPKRWEEVAPMRFREKDGQDQLLFKPDQNGRMQMVLPYPFFIGQRVGILENRKVLLPVLGFSIVVMLLTVSLWPVSWFVRRHYSRKLELNPIDLLIRIAVRLAFILDLIFIVALVALTIYGLTHLEVFSDRGNRWFHLIQSIGILGAAGTVAVVLNAAYAWMNKRRRIWGKLLATVMVLASFGFLWFAFAGNLFHFSSNY